MDDTTSIFHNTGSKKTASPTITMVLNYLNKHSYRTTCLSPYELLCAQGNLAFITKRHSRKRSGCKCLWSRRAYIFWDRLNNTYTIKCPPITLSDASYTYGASIRWLELQTGKAQVQTQENQRALYPGWKKEISSLKRKSFP